MSEFDSQDKSESESESEDEKIAIALNLLLVASVQCSVTQLCIEANGRIVLIQEDNEKHVIMFGEDEFDANSGRDTEDLEVLDRRMRDTKALIMCLKSMCDLDPHLVADSLEGEVEFQIRGIHDPVDMSLLISLGPEGESARILLAH